MAQELGVSLATVRTRRWRLGVTDTAYNWTAEQETLLHAWYAGRLGKAVDLKTLAQQLDKLPSNICRKARELGIDRDRHRQLVAVRKQRAKFDTQDAVRAHLSTRMKAWIAEHGHPRGALGMKHTAETKARISLASKRAWRYAKATNTGFMSPENTQRRSDSMSRRQATDLRLRRGFSLGSQGRREDLGGLYVRSSWEANIARYLNWLKERGDIFSWEYEPETFWFEKIKRGVRSYKPDFRIKDTADSTPYYWEVKGWDYPRGKTARARMARYHPHIKLVLVDAEAYRAIAKWKDLIPGWETGTGGSNR